MIDVDDWFKFSLMNTSNRARRARTVHGAEGPMHRHSNRNLSSLQEHVSLWCKGNDWSLSWAFWRSTSSKNQMIRENLWATYEIAVLQRLAQFQALCSLQFHTLNIHHQQRPMLNTSFHVLAGANRALARETHVQALCKFSSRTPVSWAE